MTQKENYIKLPEFTGENIPVAVAAKIMKKDQQFIRQGMIQGILPIGSALKKEKSSQYDLLYFSIFILAVYRICIQRK